VPGGQTKINSKGQVTIPAPLRERYGLHEGDGADVIEDGRSLRIVRAEASQTRGQRLTARMRGRATTTMSTDELMEMLRGEMSAVDSEREQLPCPAGFLAGRAFLAYRRRGGQRRSPRPDFYIGAHAAVRGYRPLTRDSARYRTYFSAAEVIAP
jgi:AbrB family looped-hinge helix DNA binding protein